MRALLIGLALMAGSAAEAAPRYRVTVLERPGGELMFASGINSSGDIVGGTSEAEPMALLRRADGSYVELGRLGGTRSFANAISNNGTIAMQGRTGDTGLTSLPAVKFPGQAITPIPLPEGGHTGQARDVNDAGTVVGVYRQPVAGDSAKTRAFRWTSDGGLISLDLGGDLQSAWARAVNASGAAAASALRTEGQRAIRWEANGNVTILDSIRQPDSLFFFSSAEDINDAGVVVGNYSFSTPTGVQEGMAIWGVDGEVVRKATFTNGFGHFAYAINNHNVAVGTVVTDDGLRTENIGWIWGPDGEPIDLGSLVTTPGVRIFSAFDINDRGQILAWGVLDGRSAHLLLDPLGAAPVPEPQSWALMMLGFGAAGGAMRRSRRAAPALRAA